MGEAGDQPTDLHAHQRVEVGLGRNGLLQLGEQFGALCAAGARIDPQREAEVAGRELRAPVEAEREQSVEVDVDRVACFPGANQAEQDHEAVAHRLAAQLRRAEFQVVAIQAGRATQRRETVEGEGDQVGHRLVRAHSRACTFREEFLITRHEA